MKQENSVNEHYITFIFFLASIELNYLIRCIKDFAMRLLEKNH